MIMNKKTIKRLLKDSAIKNKNEPKNFNLKSAIIEESALTRGLEVKRINKHIVLITIKGNKLVFEKMNGPLSSVPLKYICDEKDVSRTFIRDAGINVPLSKVVELRDYKCIEKFCQEVGYPVVIKPKNGARGKGVFTDINNFKTLKKMLNRLADELGSKHNEILIEKQYYGDDYRSYVVGDQIVSVTKRERASVVGDGIKTIKELIIDKNDIRAQNRYLRDYPIPIIEDRLLKLYRDDKSLDYIPEINEHVTLRDESNLSAGGDSIDYTDMIHPKFREIILNTVSAIPGLKYTGVDIIADDITTIPAKDNYVVTEIEYSPAPISMYPWRGKKRDMGLALIDFYIDNFH